MNTNPNQPQIDQTDNYLIIEKMDNLNIEIANNNCDTESPSIDTPREIVEYTQNRDLLILLDWDDSLFPTTFIVQLLKNINSTGCITISVEHMTLLNKLGESTLKLLSDLISKHGASNIHIVSNSVDGWIKESLCIAANISAVYKQIEILLTKNITMDSAQTMYAQNNTLENSTPVKWKQFCFTAIINSTKNGIKLQYSHILSIGDQWTDHHSVKQMIKSLNINSSMHHIIKLKNEPNLNDMINEMRYIQTCFDRIFHLITPEFIQPIVVDYHSEEINYMKNFAKNENMQ